MSRLASSGALVLAAFLAGCGAGGGDGGGGGCPAGSVLTIFPASARVTAGGPAITFGGGVTNCQEMINWSLTGPGSLDRSQGVPVAYTPPASVAATTSATLTASVGSLTKSATITIDPASAALTGKVIATNGAPIEGATVTVDAASATTNAAGAFALSGVSPPYDISASGPGGQLTSFYFGLRRMDPTLVIFDLQPSFPQGGLVSGALVGGAGFPQPAGHETGIAFKSAEVAGSAPVLAGASTFQLAAGWSGASTVTGELHALQWQVDADGRPVSYDGYGGRTGVALVDHSATTGQDLTLGPISAKAISGTIVNQATANTAPLSLFATVANGARIRLLPPPSDPSSFPYLGFQSTFSVPTPAVPGATIDVVGRQDYAGMAWQEVHQHGLAADATGVTMAFGGLPMQDLPLPGATVGPGTTFSWFSMPDSPVYVVSFRGQAGSAGYDIFTTAQSFTIPLGFPLPAGAAYTWLVRGSSAFSTVEGAVGPGGYMAPAAAYRIAQTPPRSFTIAP